MQKIKYFDAHCDTVFRCYLTGEGMRSNGGHIALDRAGVFDSYAQVFTFFHAKENAEKGEMLAVAKKMYDLFTSELEKNSDLMVHCKTADDINDTGSIIRTDICQITRLAEVNLYGSELTVEINF